MAKIVCGEQLFGATLRHVYLTPDEFAVARDGGERRYTDSIKHGLTDYLQKPSKTNHIVGAVGEVAVRQLLGEPLIIKSIEYNIADIAPDIQVRCTRAFFPKSKDTDNSDWIIVGCRWWATKRGGRQCVTIWGALRVSTIRRDITESDPGHRGKPARFVHWADFRDIQPLIDRGRQNANRKIQNADRQADGDVSAENLDGLSGGCLL